jgi:uncharacterized protein (DUF111 family)
VKIECEVDDMSPQLFEPASDKLLAAGALDVFLTAVQMKKGRPGTLITVIAPEDQRSAHLRRPLPRDDDDRRPIRTVSREVLDRRWEEVSTAGGSVRIKVSGPSRRDVERRARVRGLSARRERDRQPVKHVQAEAMRAWLDRITMRDCPPRRGRPSCLATS